ncbi:hypothetical protein SAMD00023353_0602890 [Rosellinia necatrix]|uniref:Uncharacterized protein n=1 Tax=Rosellinia necatrix TaxID=77044 RepID=A0A1S8A6V4_ROSNE|nr:hypothetical protein SAMD00023353_0602890 [Rosellinia necatrix]
MDMLTLVDVNAVIATLSAGSTSSAGTAARTRSLGTASGSPAGVAGVSGVAAAAGAATAAATSITGGSSAPTFFATATTTKFGERHYVYYGVFSDQKNNLALRF